VIGQEASALDSWSLQLLVISALQQQRRPLLPALKDLFAGLAPAAPAPAFRQGALAIPSPVRPAASGGSASPAAAALAAQRASRFQPLIRSDASSSGAGLLELLASSRCRASVAHRLRPLLQRAEACSGGGALLCFLEQMGDLVSVASSRWGSRAAAL
jgi:hypothetical protein